MKTRTALQGIARAIADEAESNPEFDAKLRRVLQLEGKGASASRAGKARRRSPAVLDPVAVVRDGELALRRRLEALDIEQLKDIVSQYGLDPSRLVMKWKTRERVIDHVVSVSMRHLTSERTSS